MRCCPSRPAGDGRFVASCTRVNEMSLCADPDHQLATRGALREAMLEKKAVRREQARTRGESPDLVAVTGGGNIMGGDDSFAAAKARQGFRLHCRLTVPSM